MSSENNNNNANKKIILIFGATGSQGGSLARAILNDPGSGFAVRAFVRDANKPAAQKLKDHGAELFVGDLSDSAKVKEAFKGVYGAYLVTFFWEHMDAEREHTEAKLYAEACKESGVQHAIWSTYDDTRKLSPLSDRSIPATDEKYKTPHCDAKSEGDEEFKKLNVPTTFLITSFFYDNFIKFGMGPEKGQDGQLRINLPLGQKPHPCIASEDIGKAAYGIFKAGSKYLNKYVGIVGQYLTGEEIAKTFSDVLGKNVIYHAVPFEEYRRLDFPGAADLSNMFQYAHDFNDQFCGNRNSAETKQLNPEVLSLKDWVEQHKSEFKV